MSKKYTVTDAEIKHYMPPDLSGRHGGVRPQTVEEIEALQQKAYEEARQEGFAKGVEEGKASVQVQADEFRSKGQQLQKLMNFLNQPLREMDQQVEHQLADLAVLLARLLLKKEAGLDAQHIHNLVNQSLEYLPARSRDIRVRLNPDDIALLSQADVDVNEQSWACVPDTTVTAGGCIVESEASHIDASVETRLQQLVEQLDMHPSSGAGDEHTE